MSPSWSSRAVGVIFGMITMSAVGIKATTATTTILSLSLDNLANTVSPTFASITIDSGELYLWVNGRFAFDTPKMRTAAKALSSTQRTILRIGGTDGDRFYYDMSESPLPSPPDGFTGLLNTSHIDALLSFCDATDMELIFAINGGPVARNSSTRAWDPDLVGATQLVQYITSSSSATGTFYGWELGNEPNLYWFPSNSQMIVSGKQLADDFRLLRSIVDTFGSPDHRIIGPDVAFQTPVLGEILPTLVDFVSSICENSSTTISPIENNKYSVNRDHTKGSARRSLDVLTWHWYPLQSTKSFPPVIAKVDPWAVSTELAVSPRTMARWKRWQGKIEAMAADCAGGALEAWVGEMSLACFGGKAGVTDTFADTFWFLDSLGTLAAGKHSVVLRQELVGAYDPNFGKMTAYGLFSSDADYSADSLKANPDFWATLLHKGLMGQNVLKVASSDFKQSSGHGSFSNGSALSKLRAYAHCSTASVANASSSISVMLLNIHEDEAATVELNFISGKSPPVMKSGEHGIESSSWSLYLMTSANITDPLSSRDVLLNGQELTIDSETGEVPNLLSYAVPIDGGSPIALPPFSVAFVIAQVSEASAVC